MTRRLAGTAVLALTLGALPLMAQEQGRGMHPPAPGMLGHVIQVLQQLDLTDAQKQQVHQLFMAERPDGALGQQVREAEQKLHMSLLADTPDVQAIETAKAALNAAHAAELDKQIELMQKVAQILTPEQRQQLLNMPHPGPRGRGGAGR